MKYAISSLLLLVAASSCHGQYSEDLQQRQEPARGGGGGGGGGQYEEGVQENEGSAGQGNGIEPLDPSIPEPPSQIPETSFVCDGKPYDPGMYADEETNCRVYHMCYRGVKSSFICGTGTIFNQEILSCDYPDNVDCAASQSFYSANTELGKSSPEPSGDSGSQRPRPRPSGARPSSGGNTGGGNTGGSSTGSGQAPDADYGGALDNENEGGQDEYGQAPQPAPRPRPNARPAARPNQSKTPAARPPPAPQRPDFGGAAPAPRPAPRPSARPAPRPSQKTNPRPRPARPQQRPVEQPIVQRNEQLVSLDYEPSQVIQRRSSRQLVMTRRNPSRRWQMYSRDS